MGRHKMTKQEKIAAALARGMTVNDIVKRYKVAPSTVYAARARMQETTVIKPEVKIETPAPVPTPAPTPGIVSLAPAEAPEASGIGTLSAAPAGSVEVVKPLTFWQRLKRVWGFK